MIKLPYPDYTRHAENESKPRTRRRCQWALDHDRLGALLHDASLVYWSDAEAEALCRQLHTNIGNGSGVESIGLAFDAEEPYRRSRNGSHWD